MIKSCSEQQLDLDEITDVIAQKVADKLAVLQVGELIDAAELAERIGRTRAFIYANKAQLGAIQLGPGPRPRLSFRWPHVLDQLSNLGHPVPDAAAAPARLRRTRRRSDIKLLPVKGRE